MSTLQEFLNSNVVEGMTKEVAISERIKDKDGKFLKFKIKSMSQKEIKELRRKHTKYNKKGKSVFDSEAFSEELVIENTIDPNFKDAESIRKTGCATSYQYLNKVLLAGEVTTLEHEILVLSGFGTDIDELIEEVKN